MQIAFYEGIHPGHVVPRLIEKVYSQKQRGVIWAPDAAMYQALHDVLWTFSKTSFIPHGGKADSIAPAEQPFWFTHTLENPNQADVMVMVGCPVVEVSHLQNLNFSRVVDVFEVATDNHHQQYNAYEKTGLAPQWWTHTAGGWKAKQITSNAA